LAKANALSFIKIPQRSNKPRKSGLTIARDCGIGYSMAQDVMETVGQYIDFIKMRHFFTLTAPIDPDHVFMRKIKLYRDHDIDVFPGGIVFELSWLQDKVEETFLNLTQLGFSAVECSENIIDINMEEKAQVIKKAKSFGLKVLFEVGEKYPDDEPLDVDLCAEEMKQLLDAGADLIILERAQSDILLGEKGERPEAKRLIELVGKVGLKHITFEAEKPDHQVWLVKTFGPEVNIGPNIDPDYVAKFEPIRRTLNREIGYTWVKELKAKKKCCIGG